MANYSAIPASVGSLWAVWSTPHKFRSPSKSRFKTAESPSEYFVVANGLVLIIGSMLHKLMFERNKVPLNKLFGF